MENTTSTDTTSQPTDQSTGGQPVDQSTQQSTAEQIYDLTDGNRMIKVPGQANPVKFSEYSRQFQSQFTKASQKAAQLEKELAVERAKREAYERSQQQTQQPQGQQEPAIYEQLRALPFLSGQDAVNVVQQIGEQFKQRDMVILAALKKLQEFEQTLNGLSTNSTNQAFESKIGKFLSDGGYGEDLRDIATELYLAYEPGPELDEAFPGLLADRVKQLEAYLEAKRQKALSSARRTFVPGKGGNAGPTKPVQLDPRASAASTADALWETLQRDGT